MQGRPPASARRRKAGRDDGLGLKPLRAGGIDHAVAHEGSQRVLVEVLQLASAAGREVTARRSGVVRPRQQRAIGGEHISRRGERHVPPRRCDAIAPGGDAEDRFGFAHSAAA
jgi:hypothetical protein